MGAQAAPPSGPIPRGGLFVPMLAALVGAAWAVLWIWERSPYGRYLDHGQLGEVCLTGGLPAWLAQAAWYAGGWLLMTAAMMLPTTIPLLEIFRRLTRSRTDRGRLLLLVIFGYLAVWLGFGVAAHLLDLGLYRAFAAADWLRPHRQVLGAAPLLLAGAFQFSALKYRCLDECRAPLGFVVRHWRGGAPAAQALALGAHHGLYCVGCCWALMLVMFAVGAGNLGWMLLLAAVMAIEKNAAWGRRLAAPLGVTLLAWGALVASGPWR